MKLLAVILPLLLLLLECTDSQVYSRKRYRPNIGRSRFTLTSRSQSQPSLRYGGKFSSARHSSRYGSSSRLSSRARLGSAAALKAGKDGSYSYGDQFNAILPGRAVVKPTKPPTTTTTNPNKINIESRLPAVTEPRTRAERAVVGGTAILHCYFDDNQIQIGEYKHSQIWWTKQPSRATDRPIILGAGTQVRLPDDRLRLVNFAGESYSILIIREVLMTDAADYKCSLPTVSGTRTEFTSLQVYDSSSENIATSPKESIAEVGSSLDLYCRPESNLKVWWTATRSSGETMEIIRGQPEIAGRELNLTNLRHDDSGTYTCHVQVLVGSPIRKEFTLKVKERPWAITAFSGGFNIDTFLSKFSKDPEYGDQVNLRCDSGGVPTPSFSWWFGDEQLADGNKYKITTHEPSYTTNAIIGSLTILDFSPEDEGRYHCRALNDMGHRQREFTVKGFYNKAVDRVASVDDEDLSSFLSSDDLALGSRMEGSGEDAGDLLGYL